MKAFTRSARAFRITSACSLIGVSIAVLAGCAPSTPAATPAPTVTVTVTPTSSPAPTPTWSASSSPAATTGSPVTIACSSLVADATIAAISPDFKTDPGAEVSGDNSFATIAGLDGRLCSWLNSASGSSISVGVANPGSASLATNEAKIKASGTANAALSGTSGNRGYVESNTEAPVFDVFTESGYWISISSIIFDSPSSADSILSNILQTLPAG
ncbi:hypothetical protein B7R54_17195 [Subtercola boreus]|uniref:Iron ABC transporter ATP-binding protein n=1 Tax=Subtercola boreus TaxID=120213 RepID=A0A3E0VM39_9MICO|nr:hypothetical protein [Subtercola boreus]RFA10745.1 hypothetical protein B7R54_17195 [Subtercola boreus]TQL55685.1 hypothetical protein FB464_3254 [Subtercola boreus]